MPDYTSVPVTMYNSTWRNSLCKHCRAPISVGTLNGAALTEIEWHVVSTFSRGIIDKGIGVRTGDACTKILRQTMKKKRSMYKL